MTLKSHKASSHIWSKLAKRMQNFEMQRAPSLQTASLRTGKFKGKIKYFRSSSVGDLLSKDLASSTGKCTLLLFKDHVRSGC